MFLITALKITRNKITIDIFTKSTMLSWIMSDTKKNFFVFLFACDIN